MAAERQASASAMQVAVDPATGQIRPLTPEEVRDMAGETSKLLRPARPMIVQSLADGTQLIAVDESLFNFYVARTDAGGQIVTTCVDSASDAVIALGPEVDSIIRLKPAGVVSAPRLNAAIVLEEK